MQKENKSGVIEPHIELQGINCAFYNWLYEDIFIEQNPDKPILQETYLSVMD